MSSGIEFVLLIARIRTSHDARCEMALQPGDTVSFTHDRKHWIIGEIEEIRRGFEGNHILVVRQGNTWTGSRYLVLSSYAKLVA